MQKINIVGSSGSGKSIFGRKLADILGFSYIEMDTLFWKGSWVEKSNDEFFSALKRALAANENWVLDGNYSRTIGIKWREIDTVIWLDYSFPRTVYQVLKRTIIRISSKQELWPGTSNTESFKRTFLSKDSILLWTIQNYTKNRRKYRQVMVDERYANIKFVRLSSPKKAVIFLKSIDTY